jgi:hypothetical protein
MMIPDKIGKAVLGESWYETEPLLPVFVWMYLASAAALGALYGLRALADAQRSLRTRLALSPLMILAGGLGASFAGSLGAVAGLALANTIALPVWWLNTKRSINRNGSAVNQRGPDSTDRRTDR